MSRLITAEQIAAYKENPEKCPFCEDGDDLHILSRPHFRKGSMTVEVECFDCGTRWKESYELLSIGEATPPREGETRDTKCETVPA